MLSILSSILSALLALTQAFTALSGVNPEKHIRNDAKPPNVFVGGWLSSGENTGLWYIMPTFGITGNVPRMLEEAGYECYVSSPGSFNSNWDRACNLYAEMMGTRVDYGAAHAADHGHARYGREYAEPLVPDWGPERPVNLLGHSLGGQTIYLFAHLMAEGSAEERAAAEDGSLSPLFEGGKSNLIHSVTTLGGILNGTNAEPFFLGDWFYWVQVLFFSVNVPIFQYTGLEDVTNYISTNDHSMYDMSPEGASAMNMKTNTQSDIYYFSYVLNDCTLDEENDKWHMNLTNLTSLPTGPVAYGMGALINLRLSRFEGQTYMSPGGEFTIDESWRANDGLANVVSSQYPFGSPHKDYDANNLERGTWQVMPLMQGYYHGFFGGFDFRYTPEDLFAFYMEHFEVLDGTLS